jgi:hypothetical protein
MISSDFEVVILSESWRRRASECRKTAEKFRHGETRKRMMRVAEEFDRMAAQAAEQEISHTNVAAIT